MKLERSQRLLERAQKSMAGGVSSHFRALDKPMPMFFQKAKGSHVYDADGNKYLDYTLSQGPMILGHSCPEILKAVKAELNRAQLFAGQHQGEIQLSELFQKCVPCADMSRFSLTGSEAIQTALRLARAHTGRTRFVKFEGHYHGWFDNVLISVSPNEAQWGDRDAPEAVAMTQGQVSSVLEEVIVLPWNDLDVLRRTLQRREREVAAVLMEPMMCNSGCIPPREGYLEGVRDVCDRTGIPLIFDEIITGFRCSLGGAQGLYEITPDLATFGKAMAGGFPISAIAGGKHLMELIASGRVLHAGTFNTYNIGVAASVATIQELKARRGAIYRLLNRHGQQLIEGIRRIARDQKKPILVQGPGPVFHVGFTDLPAVHDYRQCRSYDTARYGRLVQAMRERGIRLIGRGIWYHSAAHTDDDIGQTLVAFEASLREV